MRLRAFFTALLAAFSALSFSGVAFAGDQWPELPYDPCYRLNERQFHSSFCNDPWGGGTLWIYGVNAAGTLVGSTWCPAQDHRAFYWPMDGEFTYIPLPPGHSSTRGIAVNDSGDIVVDGYYQPESRYRPLVWNYRTGDHQFVDWSFEGSPASLIATSMNQSGEVVGYLGVSGLSPSNIAYRWKDGVLTLLQDHADFGNLRHVAWSISDDGTIAGQIIILIDGVWRSRPFVYTEGKVSVFQPIGKWYSGWATLAMDGGRFAGRTREHPVLPLTHRDWFAGDMNGYHTHVVSLPTYRATGFPGVNAVGDMIGGVIHVDGTTVTTILRQGQLRIVDRMLVESDEPNVHLTGGVSISSNGHITTHTRHLEPAPAPLGDLNADCRVDFEDLLLLLKMWGEDGGPGDFDGDGVVGPGDLAILFDRWNP